MMRFPLLLAALAIPACSPDPAPAPPRDSTPTEAAKPAPLPASAATGIVRLRESHDLWREVVEALERRVTAAKADGSARPKDSEIDQAIEGVRATLDAAQLAVDHEARDTARRRHDELMKREAEIHQRMGDAASEADERERIVSGIQKGTREVPEGRTVAELQDSIADLREEIRALKKEIADLKVQMGELEALLKQDRIAPLGQSLLTLERDSVKSLLARAEALRDR
ncbi:MAG: hypothetical protein ACT4PV_04310 [Planctomycetaceae bacterium]